MKKTLSLIMALLFLVSLVGAQSLEERLQQLAAKNAKSYVNPLVTAFGSAMNSGWFYTAKPHKLLGFDLGVRVMAVGFPEDQKSFTFDFSSLGSIDQTVNIGGTNYSISLQPEDIYPETKVPTFFGKDKPGSIVPDETGIVAEIKSQLSGQGVPSQVLNSAEVQNNIASIAANIPGIVTPPGTNLPTLPLVVPQASVGISLPVLPIKADIVARYFPETELSEEIGKFKFMGLGGKLALDPFVPFPLFGVKIAAGAFIQKMSIGKVFESNNSLYSLIVSRDFSLLVLGVGVYGAVGKEKTDVKINYTYTNENDLNDPLNGTKVKFDLTGENKFRTTVGARLRLAIININADYSMGADKVATVGLGLTLR